MLVNDGGSLLRFPGFSRCLSRCFAESWEFSVLLEVASSALEGPLTSGGP